MKATRLTVALANAQADVLGRLLDAGWLYLYDGTQPATADTALDGQQMLARVRIANPSAPAAANGLLSLAFINPGPVLASGTASWFRLLKADAVTPLLDGTVGLAADLPNLTLPTLALVAGGELLIDTYSHTVALATPGY